MTTTRLEAFEVAARKAGAEVERIRIRRAIAGPLRELHERATNGMSCGCRLRGLLGAELAGDLPCPTCTFRTAVADIDDATRKPRAKKAGRGGK